MRFANNKLIANSPIDKYLLYVRQRYYKKIIKAEKDVMSFEIFIGDNIDGKGPPLIHTPTYEEFSRTFLWLPTTINHNFVD